MSIFKFVNEIERQRNKPRFAAFRFEVRSSRICRAPPCMQSEEGPARPKKACTKRNQSETWVVNVKSHRLRACRRRRRCIDGLFPCHNGPRLRGTCAFCTYIPTSPLLYQVFILFLTCCVVAPRSGNSCGITVYRSSVCCCCVFSVKEFRAQRRFFIEIYTMALTFSWRGCLQRP